jgi:AcrR family transcriptional regulator
MPRKTPARPRNAEATRKAILLSARRAFADSGYDGAGVREIAAGAGVTAMMVNRYFGSKEQLFAEAVVQTMQDPIILTDKILTSPTPGRDIAAALVTITDTGATPLDGFLVLLRSASSERAAEIGREQVELHHQRTMTAALKGKDARARAALVLAIVAGVQMMRQMLRLSPLADAKPEVLIRLLGPLFQQIIDGN